MREIDQERRFKTKVLKERTIHIFGVGFEERCLAYPKFLKDANPRAGGQVFLCVSPPDDNVSGYLQAQREHHRSEIKNILPSTRVGQLEEIEREIDAAESPENFCVDISTLPRTYVFVLLEKVLLKSGGSIPVHIVYTYPKNYAYGSLEEPSTSVNIHFPEPKLTSGNKVSVIMLPGFDRGCSDIALTHIKAATGKEPSLQWQFPFPGRIYAYYERALENHIDLIRSSTFSVYPQEEINLAFERFKGEIESMRGGPIFYVPLGPRITCVSVLLAALWARDQKLKANILVPLMRQYTSIRSEGYRMPLIEELRYPTQ